MRGIAAPPPVGLRTMPGAVGAAATAGDGVGIDGFAAVLIAEVVEVVVAEGFAAFVGVGVATGRGWDMGVS